MTVSGSIELERPLRVDLAYEMMLKITIYNFDGIKLRDRS